MSSQFPLAPSALLLLALLAPTVNAAPRVLASGVLPDDVRLQAPKDLNGYFPFTPAASKAAWAPRADYVRRQILVSQGLWPMPTKTPLNVVSHGRIDRPDYSVEKVYFESAPGFFVTGNLYRPKNITGKVPGVLFAHGHWKDARLSEETEAKLRQEIATGQERFEQGGRSRFQSMCVQLARMGCVVWQWDMLSDSDSLQFTEAVVHRFAKQRPEMNTTTAWGLYSPQAEANLQSIMGLQTWNAVRSLDFLLSLPEVDPDRTAITGASGGGTQTMLLAAIDPRVQLSFPAVMVSTAMQGGCTCENASLLRVNTGNVEFAALFAPKPQGMTTANDWTKEMATKGFPELKQHYTALGAPNAVMLHRGEHFPHNYNAVSRSAFYTWLNRHFKLGFTEPVIERDFEPLSRAQLSVWDARHPAPTATGPAFERSLLQWFTTDAESQLRASAASPERFRQTAGSGVEVLIGRTYAEAGDVTWQLKDKQDRGGYLELTGTLRNTTHREELPVIWLYPKKPNGRAIVWLDDAGKAALYTADGALRPAVRSLVDAGVTVLGADLLFQGEFLANGQLLTHTRLVANPREFAGYTFGYNHALFAQRTHDVLTLVAFLRNARVPSHPNPTSVAVAGYGRTGPIVAATRAVAGAAIDRAVVTTGGFRFGQLLDYRDPSFLPGGAKYLDVPGLLALSAPHPLWVAGEGKEPALVSDLYRTAGKANQLAVYNGAAAELETASITWLMQE
ncbi:dienelactone hydrolase family protein [Horticoccus sp. 23ND18S-11]|uniref:dienelactone hydrolase family protein n=1 Tax=Horticoccus sp. 23ND18S-11 TaxID=3391832 RepID=UPI0039C94E32